MYLRRIAGILPPRLDAAHRHNSRTTRLSRRWRTSTAGPLQMLSPRTVGCRHGAVPRRWAAVARHGRQPGPVSSAGARILCRGPYPLRRGRLAAPSRGGGPGAAPEGVPRLRRVRSGARGARATAASRVGRQTLRRTVQSPGAAGPFLGPGPGPRPPPADPSLLVAARPGGPYRSAVGRTRPRPLWWAAETAVRAESLVHESPSRSF